MSAQDLILNDFLNGGFPISRRSPVFCIINEGTVMLAYNRYMLHSLIESGKVKSCYGVWPGKRYTGVFNISIKDYFEGPYPPQMHADIDSADQITVQMENGEFDCVIYVPGPHEKDRTPIKSTDPKLFEYIKAVSLRHQIIP